jgi:Uma2 family endonuclease
MASPTSTDLLDHEGPWTEEEFLALPVDNRRIELLDGGLLVSPLAASRHQRMSSRLWATLDAAAPEGFEVLMPVNVRVAPGRILNPDLVVVTTPGVDVVMYEAAVVAMAVEIVSPGSVTADRAIKPQLYAAAGIRHYLRVELGGAGPWAVVYRLRRGRYAEVTRAEAGERLRLTRPFALDVDLGELAARTRPPPQ